jgi:hypothetical protein
VIVQQVRAPLRHPPVRRAAPRSGDAARFSGDAALGAADNVLRLQRSAGNRAVQRLLDSGGPDRHRVAAPVLHVQRQPIPDSPMRTQMIKDLVSEHPGLNPRVASEAVDAALHVMGAGGAGGDVVLTQHVTREVSVHTGQLTAQAMAAHLQEEARQAGVREIYLQVNSQGADRRTVRQVMDAIQNGIPELDGVRVRIYSADGAVVWKGNMRFRDTNPVAQRPPGGGGSPGGAGLGGVGGGGAEGQARAEPAGNPAAGNPAAGLPPAGDPTAGAPAVGTETAGTAADPSTSAYTGAGLEPVVEATPGFNPELGGGIGGALQLVQAMQVAGLESAEIAKYQARYTELEPKIDKFLAQGYSVELTLIVEKPVPDFMCQIGAFCESDQVIYFHDLFISRALAPEPVIKPTLAAPSDGPTMSAAGGRDSVIPYPHQGGSIIEDSEIPFLRPRDSNHHMASAKYTIDPPPRIRLAVPAAKKPGATHHDPPMDEATRVAKSAGPTAVYVLCDNVVQYKTASRVVAKLAGNSLFGEVKEYTGGGANRSRTVVVYFADLDRSRAEALAEIARPEVPAITTEMSGAGKGEPGHVQIMFGSDSEK